MAYYDFERDKIYGCKKGSMQWLHERGHQVLHNTRFIQTFYRTYHVWLLLFCILYLTIQDYFGAKIFLGIYIFFVLFDELFAWAYVVLRWFKWL